MSSLAKRVLLVLAAAQFLMVLDQAVMNVSISQLVADFDTDVTTIQAVITFSSFVTAALMITGGKLGADSQLDALKAGLLFAAFVVLVSFLGTQGLPSAPLEMSDAIDDAPAPTG